MRANTSSLTASSEPLRTWKRAFSGRGGSLSRQDRLAEQLQQQLVQQAHVHDRAVVALHELLDRERVGGVLVAEHLRAAGSGDRTAAGPRAGRSSDVQAEAHLPQEGLRLLQAPQLRRREKAVRRQLIERVGAEVALGHPGDGLDVAQAARARS